MKIIKLLCASYPYRGYKLVASDYDSRNFTDERISEDAKVIFRLLVCVIPAAVYEEVFDLLKAWKKSNGIGADKFLEKQNLKPHGDKP